jgi:hypothetical protein
MTESNPAPPLRLEWVDPNTLTPNPLNWRKHPKPQLDALRGALDDVGWAGAALLNEANGHFVDGHARRDIAIERSEPLPVLIGSWTEAQEREILATLDPIAAMAEADAERLDELLHGVETTDAAVMTMIESLADKSHLYETAARPDFENLIDDFQHERGASDKDGNWFYVEYYGDDDEFARISGMLSAVMSGKHDINRQAFTEMVELYAREQTEGDAEVSDD